MTTQEYNKTDSHLLKRRGKLKIFLGALPGVGKTFKMLSEANRRYARGEDIVIGFVETHGRPATAKLLEGLEQVPLKRLEYRDKTFYELDTAAVIARKPRRVVVDELAHTNIPGAVHPKRWQSIEEIRDAGINVLTTVNVQHLESLNDTIFEITGVRVRETVPDIIVDSADDVELVDLTPNALINRLKRGDIYKKEKISQALTNFFRKGNIVALRELALRITAEEVDEKLHEYMIDHHMEQGKAARNYVVVCFAPRLLATKLVRRGYILARRLQGDFHCVYVRVPGAKTTRREDAILKEVSSLAINFGGKVIELEGESVAKEIIKFVNEKGATFIVMGQSARSRWQEITRGSIINRVMRETKNVDILVVADVIKEDFSKLDY